MPQLFPPGANTVLKWVLIGAPVLAILAIAFLVIRVRTPWATKVGHPVDQPVQFSHAHHVGGLGIDCRYCHVSVEHSSFADIPPTETCMSCHSQVWTNAEILAPVRESYRTGEPIPWRRVNDLPDFTYFNHAIHVRKGVACITCHGRVDRMPLMAKGQTLQMSWCLDCHRDPAPNLRPREKVFDMAWSPEEAYGDSAYKMGRAFIQRYHVDVANLTDCTRCHR
jgi:hypothetical protein